MKHSSFRQPLPAALFPLVSMGYQLGSDDKPKPYEFINMAPAGSLASTGTDMGRFMIAHLQLGAYGTGRILRADTATRMHTSAQTSIGPLNRMELGFYETNINGHRSISHGGDTQWFHSYLHLFPDDGVGLYVSMNSGGKDGAAHAVRTALFQEFANRYLPGPGPTGEGVDAKTAKLHAQQMLGQYESSRRRETGFMALAYLPGQAKVIINEDGTISVPALTGLNEVPKKWREIAPYVWRDVAGTERIAAEVVDGKVTRFSTDPISPFMVFERTSWTRSAAWIVPALIAESFGAAADGPGLAGLGDGATSLQEWPMPSRAPTPAPTSGCGSQPRPSCWPWAPHCSGSARMLTDLEQMVPGNDWMVLVLRLLNLVVLPIGAAIATWNAWQVITSKRRLWAKLWSVVLAASCLFLLWLGVAYHVVGFNGTY